MAGLTSEQIKTQLDTIDWAGNNLPVIRVFKSVQTDGRERYPRIDIENKSKTNSQKDVLLNKLEQQILIHLNFRIKGEASDEEDKVGQAETLVAANLDGFVLNGQKINIENFNWDRQTVLKPAKHIRSVLTIFVSDITSQTGDGVTGKQTTIDIGSITGLQVLGETGNDGLDSIRKWDTTGQANNISGGEIGTQFFEYEYTKARFDTIKALILAKAYITITIHETGQADTLLDAKPVDQSKATRYDTLKTITLQIELR